MEAFLQRIASRLGRDVRTSVERPQWKHAPQQTVFQGYSEDELLDVLKNQCTRIHTTLIETNSAELHDTVEHVIHAHGGGPIIIANDERYEQVGLSSFLKREDVYVWDATRGRHNIEAAERANIGITWSDITLAESGTVVLLNNQNQGRTISFLPTTYVALIPKSTIVPRMTQAARLIREKMARGERVPSCINFITGPSNSADIEMNLVVGVHGPVKATYIVIIDR
ncbi:L-lactate dehydrogenase complex protein LldG [Anoxybacillus mongoliensis]|uniref:Lactate utilization protein C n=1 Tax=Anoxybacillus mongoliensis TaxID=452565 RepID=A0A7W8N6A0_9BACL|nr:lactate utilization protein C [Anoxybacillus mongoliensis]MBB5354150.1 L-lactate dehydrogenase complex protein LldG [Anoxybacillus mongoliensis]MCX8001064.1 lactate utilization protein C [Anoxybacillus mongoliensis]